MAGIFGYKKNQPDGYCSIWLQGSILASRVIVSGIFFQRFFYRYQHHQYGDKEEKSSNY